MKTITRLFFLMVLCVTVTGCLYKMPEEDDVDLKPTTNNPDVIRSRQESALPGLGGMGVR